MGTQHIEVPTIMGQLKLDNKLEKGDKIIYAGIRARMNSKTRQCFPSIPYLKKTLKVGQTRIEGAIKRLVAANLLLVTNEGTGKKQIYTFPETEFDKQFEMFTEEFLLLEMPIEAKEYYMDIQQYLYGKETGTGRCALSNAELSKRTGWSIYWIKKNNTWLIEHGYLEEETSEKKDEAGISIVTKQFNLTALNQAALWVKAVTEQLTQNTEQISQNTEDIAAMKEELAELRAWKQKKEKEEALKRNQTPEHQSFDF